MKLTISESINKVSNIIFLTDKIANLKEQLSKENYTYFKKLWKEESMQFVKGTTGYVFVVKTTKDVDKIRKSAFSIHDILKRHYKEVSVSSNNSTHLLAFTEGFLLSDYQFLHYFKDADKKLNTIKKLALHGPIIQKEVTELQNLIESVYWARDMVNEPVSFLDAPQLAAEIVEKGKASNYKVEVLEKGKIESLKMGGLLAVNRGSEVPPTFTIIECKKQKTNSFSW